MIRLLCFFCDHVTQTVYPTAVSSGLLSSGQVSVCFKNRYQLKEYSPLFLEFVKETAKKPYHLNHLPKENWHLPNAQKKHGPVYFLNGTIFCCVFSGIPNHHPLVEVGLTEVRDFLFRRLCSSLPSKRHENLDEYRSRIQDVESRKTNGWRAPKWWLGKGSL